MIITDETQKVAEMADGIAVALKGKNVTVRKVSEFNGNDILPADAFFLGCEKPNPPSFSYIEDLFRHINLAGRPCGIFSPGTKETANYLSGMVHDCEAALGEEPFLPDSGKNIKTWAQSVIAV